MAERGAARLSETFHPVVVRNAAARSPVVLVCEHASNALPARFGDLGIDAHVQDSHAAYDPGAAEVARRLSARLGARLVEGGVSRLVYDCNRPPEAPDAIAAVSEIHRIPGNEGLSPAARHARVEAVYTPFKHRLEAVLADMAVAPVLVTIHTFTPVFHGKRRDVAVGVVHDDDPRLADALLETAPRTMPWPVLRNAPYGPQDRVTTTLRRHAIPQGRLNAMVEIRNDLVATAADQHAVAERMADWIRAALDFLGVAADGSEAECRG